MPRSTTKPLRRKPSQQRSLDVVSAIRTAAAQVLVHRGYARATTNRIAEAAGVSIGTLYQYFDGKDAVFDALAEHFVAELADMTLRASIETEGQPLPLRIRAMTHAGARVLQRHPGLLRALDLATGPRLRATIHATRAQVRIMFEQLLADGGAVDDETRRRARLLTVMAEGAALDVGPDDDLGWLADTFTTMFEGFLASTDAARGTARAR